VEREEDELDEAEDELEYERERRSDDSSDCERCVVLVVRGGDARGGDAAGECRLSRRSRVWDVTRDLGGEAYEDAANEGWGDECDSPLLSSAPE